MVLVKWSHVGAKLFLHSLVPSLFSLIASLIITLVIIVGHMLLLSISGSVYPAVLDDVLVDGYVTYIVDPLTEAINSSAVNYLLLVVFWGVIGFLIYGGLAHAATFISELRTVKNSITVPTENTIRRHPLAGYFVVRLAWRLLIVFLTLMLTLFLLPIVHYVLTNTEEMMRVTTAAEFVRLLGITTLWWLVIMHLYVVFLRWYALRTRLTGEILY
jgi:hypothetical protein